MLAIAVCCAVLPAPTFAAPPVTALPTGGQIVGGATAGTISTAGSAMTIQQNQQRMIANWDTYNIGQSASVHYQQPAGGVALNRVNGVQPGEFAALVENGNAVEVPGGLIILSAHAVNRLQGAAIKNNGILDASSLTMKGGRNV